VKVPFVDLVAWAKPSREEYLAAFAQVIDTGAFVGGPQVASFEGAFAKFCGAQHAIALNNGTDALLLALRALGAGPGDEVITAANSFFATAEAISHAGAKPVLVDVDPRTALIDPRAVERAISPRTKAILPVHLYGQCADMKAIRKIADAHKLRVIEDNAQAVDAAGDGFAIGELSDAMSMSFIIQKNLGTFGDGGALLTNNPDIDASVRRLRNHGSTKRNVHSYGFNSRLDDLHAGVLSAKLKHIHTWNDQRIQWAARYTAGLNGAANIDLPYVRPGYRHVFHLYVVETKNPAHRDQLLDFLVRNGIDAKTHYSIAIHKQDGYPWGKGARIVGPAGNAERNAASCISLPMYPELTAAEVDYVVAKVLEWDKAAK